MTNNDPQTLKEVFEKLLEYAKSHPNMSEGPADVAPITEPEEKEDNDGGEC